MIYFSKCENCNMKSNLISYQPFAKKIAHSSILNITHEVLEIFRNQGFET